MPCLNSEIRRCSPSFPSAGSRRCRQQCHAGIAPLCGDDDFDDISKLNPSGSSDTSSPQCGSELPAEQLTRKEAMRLKLVAAAAGAIRFLRKWALGVALAVGAMGLNLGSMQAVSLRSRGMNPVSEPLVVAEGRDRAAAADSHSQSTPASPKQPSAAALAGEWVHQRPYSMQVKNRERTCRFRSVQPLGRSCCMSIRRLLSYQTAKDSRKCSIKLSSWCRTT